MFSKLVAAFLLWGYYTCTVNFTTQLWQDLQAPGDWQMASELKITTAKCTRIAFIISHCYVSYTQFS